MSNKWIERVFFCLVCAGVLVALGFASVLFALTFTIMTGGELPK